MTVVVTEGYIKSVLDGTYTRIYEGRTITQMVDEFGKVIDEKGPNKNYSVWTPEEESLLVMMSSKKHPVADIAWALNRSIDAVVKRMKFIRAKQRMLLKTAEVG